MRRPLIALVVTAAATAMSACHAKSMDAGPMSSKAFQVGDFTKVESAGSYDVNVRTGGAPGVTVKGPQNVIDHMVVEVKDGELRIRNQDERFGNRINFGKHERVTVEVTAAALEGASIAGSGNIKVDRVQGQRFTGSIAGSGSMDVGQAEVTDVNIKVAGSGDVKIAGKATNADYSIAGSGGLDTGSLDVQNLKVSIAGSGDVNAHATGTADISILGSGDVTVTGGAKCKVSKAGSGDAHCS